MYDDNDDIIPLVIRLPQMTGYYNIYNDGNKAMNFRCDDKNVLKKYEKLFKDISRKMNKEFTIGAIYKNSNNITKIKSKVREYKDEIRTEFHNNKLPKVKTQYKCMPQIKLESINRSRESLYHHQFFLGECKYEVKNIKNVRRIRRIDFDSEKSSSDKSDNEPESDADDNEVSFDSDDNNESEKSFNESENNESKKSSNESRKSFNESENNESKKPSKKF